MDLADYVPTSGRTIVREIAARCPSTSAAGPRLDSFVSLMELIAVSRDRPLLDLDFTTGPLARRLTENVPRGPFTQPLFSESARATRSSRRGSWMRTSTRSAPRASHSSSAPTPDKTHMGVLEDDDSALPADLEQWTRDRLNGLPPGNTCTD